MVAKKNSSCLRGQNSVKKDVDMGGNEGLFNFCNILVNVKAFKISRLVILKILWVDWKPVTNFFSKILRVPKMDRELTSRIHKLFGPFQPMGSTWLITMSS